MGTDRNEIYNSACPCGSGRITITRCTPDHGWSSARRQRLDSRIECAACAERYDIRDEASGIHLALTSEIERHKTADAERNKQFDRLKEAVWQSEGAMSAVVPYLNSFSSAAAAHRQLSKTITCGPLTDFREHFRKRNCSPAWVKRHVQFWDFIKLVRLAGRGTEHIDALVAEFQKIPKPAPVSLINPPLVSESTPPLG
jgi:hypothetical protein